MNSAAAENHSPNLTETLTSADLASQKVASPDDGSQQVTTKEQEIAALLGGQRPLRLLNLPVDVLREIVKEVLFSPVH